MALFDLNTGVRDDVGLQPALGLGDPGAGTRHLGLRGAAGAREAGAPAAVVVCNSVAQSIIESQRSEHEEFVFVWRRERA